MDGKQFQEGVKQAQAQQKKQEEVMEQRRLLMQKYMTPEARERFKPEKAQKIEDMIIQNASMGALKTKVDEQSLITYLEQMNEGDKPATTIKFKRKVESDDELDF